jgi:hypothetical protein
MFVVTWEPRNGTGGGHQLALDLAKAETIRWRLCKAMPDVEVKLLPATEHAAAAVAEREQRGRRPTRPRTLHR